MKRGKVCPMLWPDPLPPVIGKKLPLVPPLPLHHQQQSPFTGNYSNKNSSDRNQRFNNWKKYFPNAAGAAGHGPAGAGAGTYESTRSKQHTIFTRTRSTRQQHKPTDHGVTINFNTNTIQGPVINGRYRRTKNIVLNPSNYDSTAVFNQYPQATDVLREFPTAANPSTNHPYSNLEASNLRLRKTMKRSITKLASKLIRSKNQLLSHKYLKRVCQFPPPPPPVAYSYAAPSAPPETMNPKKMWKFFARSPTKRTKFEKEVSRARHENRKKNFRIQYAQSPPIVELMKPKAVKFTNSRSSGDDSSSTIELGGHQFMSKAGHQLVRHFRKRRSKKLKIPKLKHYLPTIEEFSRGNSLEFSRLRPPKQPSPSEEAPAPAKSNSKKLKKFSSAAAASSSAANIPITISMNNDFMTSALPTRRSEVLLRVWLKGGPFSKVDLIQTACRVVEQCYVTGTPLIEDRKKFLDFNIFCSEVNAQMALFKRMDVVKRVNSEDYQFLYRVMGLFISALKSGITNYGELESSSFTTSNLLFPVPKIDMANLHHIHKDYIEPPSPRLSKHEQLISDHNQELLESLSIDIHRSDSTKDVEVFLLTYGFYIKKYGERKRCRKIGLNPYVRKFYEKYCMKLPGTFAPLPPHLESQIQLSEQEALQLEEKRKIKKMKKKQLKHTKKKERQQQQQQWDAEEGILDNKESSSNNNISQSTSVDIEGVESGNDSNLELPVFPVESEEEISSKRRRSRLTRLTDKKNDLGASTQRPRPPREYHRGRPKMCVTNCQYGLIKAIAQEKKYNLVDEMSDWNIMWTDLPPSLEQLAEYRRLQFSRTIFGPVNVRPSAQKLNHFPGMSEICRKDALARNLKKMKRYFPFDYDFFPETWTLPADFNKLVKYYKKRKYCTIICKPATGSQGNGIYLVQDLKSLTPFENLICQRYIQRPFLIDGHKFDMRLYVLMTCLDPLRVYIYDDGIVRLASLKYNKPHKTNLHIVTMHLTNFSLNRYALTYDKLKHKKKLSVLFEWLRKEGVNVDKIKQSIDTLVIKTLIAAIVPLKRYYQASFPTFEKVPTRYEYAGCSCFELLGFDIMIDQRLKPYLLEVNLTPSFHTELAVDKEIKSQLIRDTLDKIYLGPPANSPAGQNTNIIPLAAALRDQFEYESTHGLGYRLLFPDHDKSRSADYQRLLYNAELFQVAVLPQLDDAEEKAAAGGTRKVAGR